MKRIPQYLGVTADRDFWPNVSELYLITQGCLGGSAEDIRRVQGFVSDPFDELNVTSRAYTEIWQSTNQLISILAERLNRLHQENHSEAYWRTQIGFWALLFVSVIYDRRERLLVAQKELPGIVVCGPATMEITPPNTTIDFVYQITDDLGNLKIYTQLAQSLGMEVLSMASRVSAVPTRGLQQPISGARQYLKALGQGAYSALSKLLARRADALMVTSYLPRAFEIALFFRSFGRVSPIYFAARASDGMAVLHQGMRSELGAPVDSGQAHAGGVVVAALGLVGVCIPRIFVEDYKKLSGEAWQIYGSYQPKVIYGASAWWFDEAFKHWAARSREQRGTVLVGAEHGGAAFLSKYVLAEKMEISLVDYFVTWGWHSATNQQIVSASANKLLGIRKRKKSKAGAGIFYVATAHSRYNVGMLEDFSKYIEWQIRFFQPLPATLQQKTMVRLHPHDYGWGMKQRIQAVSPAVHFDDWSVGFRKRLAGARICVFDYVSTTFAEALASNAPSILFFNQAVYPPTSHTKRHFQTLQTAGILHLTPESAAAWLEKIYEAPEVWWQSDACQNAVREFCEEYACRNPDALTEWKEMFDTWLLAAK